MGWRPLRFVLMMHRSQFEQLAAPATACRGRGESWRGLWLRGFGKGGKLLPPGDQLDPKRAKNLPIFWARLSEAGTNRARHSNVSRGFSTQSPHGEYGLQPREYPFRIWRPPPRLVLLPTSARTGPHVLLGDRRIETDRTTIEDAALAGVEITTQVSAAQLPDNFLPHERNQRRRDTHRAVGLLMVFRIAVVARPHAIARFR